MTTVLSDELLQKARRLLLTGKVRVQGQPLGHVAEVDGDTGVYSVSRDANGRFLCTCPGYEKGVVCSHILSVQLVTE